MNKSVITLIAIVVTAAAAFYIFSVAISQGTKYEENPSVGNSTSVRIGDNAVYLSDQKPGEKVIVNLVHLAQSGFIAIHKDSSGKPGQIIGSSSLLSPGDNRNVYVALNAETVEGNNLYAMLHSDNGDNKFNPKDDTPITDSSGNAIMIMFGVSSSAPEPGSVDVKF